MYFITRVFCGSGIQTELSKVGFRLLGDGWDLIWEDSECGWLESWGLKAFADIFIYMYGG